MKFLSRFSPAIVSGVALASLVGFAGNAQAQVVTSETAESGLQVTITANCVFATNPTANGGTLVQSGTAPSNVLNLTGDFFVTCNTANFGITAKSTSGGLINGTVLIPYNLTVASNTFTGGTTTGADSQNIAQTVGTSTGFNAGCATATGCQGTFTVDVDPSGTTAVPAGIYTDTITWTLIGS